MAKIEFDERACPKCAEPIKLAAMRCKHCAHDLAPEEVEESLKKERSNNIAAAVTALLAVLLVGYCATSGSSDEEKTEDATQVAVDRGKGFHCLSKWDGSNRQFVDAVKAQLRDPDSFEHDETRITPVDAKGEHSIVMQYRAKNGFGGVNRETAVGTVKNADCSATIISTSLGVN